MKVGNDNELEKTLSARYLNDEGLGFKEEVTVDDEGSAKFKTTFFYSDDERKYQAGVDFNGKLEFTGANVAVNQGPYGVKVNYKHKDEVKELSGSWKKDNHVFQAGV